MHYWDRAGDDPKSLMAAAAVAARRLSLSSTSLQHKSLMDCSLRSDVDMTHLLLAEYPETADVGEAVVSSNDVSTTKAVNEEQENHENHEEGDKIEEDDDDDESTTFKIEFDPTIDLPTLKGKDRTICICYGSKF